MVRSDCSSRKDDNDSEARASQACATPWVTGAPLRSGVSIPASDLTPTLVTRWLSDALAARYRYVGRFDGGETGAFEVAGPDDERLVLKWNTRASACASRARAVALTDRLRREGGWPVPHQRVVELTLAGTLIDAPVPNDAGRCQVILQEHLPGEPIATLTISLASQLTGLLRSSRGLGRPPDAAPLGDTVIETLVAGGQGYCLHEPMRTYDRRTRRLIERIEAIGRSARQAPPSTASDIVHYDLHAGNVLVLDDQVTGIIDTEYATVGDGGFDLVALAVCAPNHHPDPGVDDVLWNAVDAQVAEPWRTVFVAHMLLRNVDWAIRNHGAHDVERWLREAHRLLPPR